MARKMLKVTITAECRDKGKQFIINEMGAEPLEDWAIRAFLGMAKAGIDVPQDIASAGVAGIARLGLTALSGMHIDDLRPLLAEMMQCIQYVPDPSKPTVTISAFQFPEQIEEVSTRLKLRAEWFTLHTGFFPDAKR